MGRLPIRSRRADPEPDAAPPTDPEESSHKIEIRLLMPPTYVREWDAFCKLRGVGRAEFLRQLLDAKTSAVKRETEGDFQAVLRQARNDLASIRRGLNGEPAVVAERIEEKLDAMMALLAADGGTKNARERG